ncbi:MAG TPA: sulfur globule protein precursor [Xanthobacteraceae bacterium]|nr:sulfur globule protein precursor [Xanthobacteraceae bacterium]
MFRKLVLAAAAVAALGAASLAPTAASAHGWHKGHGHWHGHFHKHWGVYPVYGGYGGCYYVRKFVPTPYGLVKKRVMVCG